MRITNRCFSGSYLRAISAAILMSGTVCVAQQPNPMPSPLPATQQPVQQEPSKQSNLPFATAEGAPALTVGAGDLVDVNVFDTPELSGKVRVNEAGEIELPIAGKLYVQGETAAEVARSIEAKLRSARIMNDPHVNVMVLEYVSQGATVYGEVARPGVYPVYGRQTLADLIAQAGGPLPTAGMDVAISHKGEPAKPIHVDFDKTNPAVTGSRMIMPGDTVVVSRAGVVYVLGAVERQGSFPVSPNGEKLTLLQALAMAEGAKSDAKLKDTKLLRTTSSGREEISVDLSRIIASRAPDMMLQQGDILFVPTSRIKGNAFTVFQVAFEAAAAVALYARP